MAHRGAQHLAIRLERADFETGGVEAGQPPILAGGIERVGRCADAELARDRGLLVPGIEAVGLHADGDVEIEPDLHAEPVRVRLAGGKLPVGVPLHEFDERDFGGVGPFAEAGAPAVVRRLATLPAIPTRVS